ncbi:hypothetical protein [Kitasatospora purpeofusca]|uniref:hypothetical protein n=1 Tax=Kitasatospora purpeofusca TaxID=67352 RepID=UPI002A59CBFF|nr:hypothetical protein [Kitasatospora purpeofusca]MDY0812232.1 hypothetical protein [Kitasatospora purpeofusca]
MCRPDAEASPHGPAARAGVDGRPCWNRRRWAGAAVVVLLLTALGLIGHHTLPAGVMPTSHAPAAMAHGTAAHGTTAHTAPVGTATAPVVSDPVRACAEHRVCSSTVPARGAAPAAPPAAALAAAARPDPAPRPAVAHPGLPWPGAPPPDLDVLSVARK